MMQYVNREYSVHIDIDSIDDGERERERERERDGGGRGRYSDEYPKLRRDLQIRTEVHYLQACKGL